MSLTFTLVLDFAHKALHCKYSLLCCQHAIHPLVYEYSHHRQGIQKLFNSLEHVAESLRQRNWGDRLLNNRTMLRGSQKSPILGEAKGGAVQHKEGGGSEEGACKEKEKTI